MHHYPATDTNLEIVGALTLEDAADGLRPYRLPAQYRQQVPTAFMSTMVYAAAGVRVRFATSATKLVVTLVARPIELIGVRPPYESAVDLVIDGELLGSASITGGLARLDLEGNEVTLEDSAPQAINFSGLRAADKLVEVWLPHTAIVDFVAIDADQPIRRAEPSINPQWVVHGSSISHCMETSHPTRTWPAIAARELGFDMVDLAYAGNALLDPFVARTIRDLPADLITLKLGINLVNANSMSTRSFAPAVHGFLDTIRDGHPETPITIISPISCPAVENRPGPTGIDPTTGIVTSYAPKPYPPDALTLQRIREALKEVVELRSVSDANLKYLDGRELFSESDARRGLLPDGLHPNETGYSLMGQRFAEWFPTSGHLISESRES